MQYNLTEEQIQEALKEYVSDKIPLGDLNILEEREQLEEQIKNAQVSIKALQEECTHPLILRLVDNQCVSDEYGDDEEWYETHHCQVCGKHWNTSV